MALGILHATATTVKARDSACAAAKWRIALNWRDHGRDNGGE